MHFSDNYEDIFIRAKICCRNLPFDEFLNRKQQNFSYTKYQCVNNFDGKYSNSAFNLY